MIPAKITSIDSPTGIIALGATVRNTRNAAISGVVTNFFSNERGIGIEVVGRHGDVAANFALVAPPDSQALAISSQSSTPVLAGALEVRVAQENDRIYFVNTPEEVMLLLAHKIGVQKPAQAAADLARALEIGRCCQCQDYRYRGCFGMTGDLAYVRRGQPQRQAPRFALGTPVSFSLNGPARPIAGIRLYADNRRDESATSWHYEYTLPGGVIACLSEQHAHAVPTALCH